MLDEDERKLWRDAKEHRAKLDGEGLILDDETLTAYLNRVLAGLILDPLPEQAPRPAVLVIRNAERNALTMPDGTILITSSMLAALDSEAQLAALLGHEVGHFIGRHGLLRQRFEKISRSTVERMNLSRQHEFYCDRFALDVVRRAGYDPREVLAMLRVMEGEEEAARAGPYQFRSHPFIPERIRELTTAIAAERTKATRSGVTEYQEAVVAILPVAAEVELKSGLANRADATISRLLDSRPQSGRAHYLRAEHARLTEPEGRFSERARLAYERAVELAPDDPEAVRALGYLYYESGERRRARALLERYLLLMPDAADHGLVARHLRAEGEQ